MYIRITTNNNNTNNNAHSNTNTNNNDNNKKKTNNNNNNNNNNNVSTSLTSLAPPGGGSPFSRGAKGVPRKGVGTSVKHEGLDMQRIESKTQSKQLLLTTPIPWDPHLFPLDLSVSPASLRRAVLHRIARTLIFVKGLSRARIFNMMYALVLYRTL